MILNTTVNLCTFKVKLSLLHCDQFVAFPSILLFICAYSPWCFVFWHLLHGGEKQKLEIIIFLTMKQNNYIVITLTLSSDRNNCYSNRPNSCPHRKLKRQVWFLHIYKVDIEIKLLRHAVKTWNLKGLGQQQQQKVQRNKNFNIFCILLIQKN